MLSCSQLICIVLTVLFHIPVQFFFFVSFHEQFTTVGYGFISPVGYSQYQVISLDFQY